MPGFLKKFANAFLRRYRPLPAERWCADHFGAMKQRLPPADKSAPLVVVEVADDLFFFGLHGEIIMALRAIRNVRVGRWTSRSMDAGTSLSLQRMIAAWLDGLVQSRFKWKRLYKSICDEPGERADRFRAPWREIAWLWRAWRLFRRLESKDQLAALTERGIRIGDLVIDTYLRFKPAAEMNVRDPYLILILRQAIKDIDNVFDYLGRNQPVLFLATYVSYIQHGIPARVAVALGIPSWSFANAQEFGTRQAPDHLLHSKRCANYAVDFSRMSEHAEKTARAGKILGDRVAGIADTATVNQRSAYEVRTRDVPDVQGAVIAFLHDFFDSAHIYRWMIFHDFWEWACETIEILEAAGVPYFLKPHPNQRAESNVELERLQKKYPNARIMSSEVSNRQLVEGGMACAVTVYGSVAAEMAYLGVSSISCGDNPHISFDTFHFAATKEDYRALLRRSLSLPRDPGRMRDQACAFYYMHYLNISPSEQDLRDRLIAFYLALVEQEVEQRSFSAGQMETLFAGLENAPGFRRFVAGLASELDAVP